MSAGYNNPDCAYPDATPAVKEVDGDGVGPWVSAAGHTLTISRTGRSDREQLCVFGPSAKTAPYNQKTINRHYGFLRAVHQSDRRQRNLQYAVQRDHRRKGRDHHRLERHVHHGHCPGRRAELRPAAAGAVWRLDRAVRPTQITAGNGKQSIDAVTVTIGGKAPTRLAAGQTIQSALDAAAPGDLIIVPAGNYQELAIMWKPVRLQGVGAASTIINANTQPAGKLDPWRRRVECLFGLSIDGQPYTAAGGANPYDSTGQSACPATGWNYFAGGPNNPQVDRIPLEGIVGWDTTVNGNLAELLQEPSLMGAYEGAGITVLAKGVNIPAGSANVFGNGAEADFPAGSTLLTSANCGSGTPGTKGYAQSVSQQLPMQPVEHRRLVCHR